MKEAIGAGPNEHQETKGIEENDAQDVFQQVSTVEFGEH
jgi:hypothetical protein